MELLDTLRSTSIAILLISVAVMGIASNFIPAKLKKVKTSIMGTAGTLGGMCGLGLFYLFDFVPDWREYAGTITVENATDYSGRHQVAAYFIKFFGESGASMIGVVFGIVGIGLLVTGIVNIKSEIKIK